MTTYRVLTVLLLGAIVLQCHADEPAGEPRSSASARKPSNGYGNGYDSGYGNGYDSGYGNGYDSGYGNGYGNSYGNGYGQKPRDSYQKLIKDVEEFLDIYVPQAIQGTGTINEIYEKLDKKKKSRDGELFQLRRALTEQQAILDTLAPGET